MVDEKHLGTKGRKDVERKHKQAVAEPVVVHPCSPLFWVRVATQFLVLVQV